MAARIADMRLCFLFVLCGDAELRFAAAARAMRFQIFNLFEEVREDNH
jgi:hypothetical protein